jgi:tRNA threonylcarbamoyladenosine biosynthesis protein TsaE
VGRKHTTSRKETHTIAKEFLHTLKPISDHATVVGFSGELGAGKTEFIRGLLRSAGVQGSVTSPTYTIESVYDLPDSAFEKAYHIDAYRLENADDLLDLGFTDRLRKPKSLILVEWANRVADALPDTATQVHIETKDNKRVISIQS